MHKPIKQPRGLLEYVPNSYWWPKGPIEMIMPIHTLRLPKRRKDVWAGAMGYARPSGIKRSRKRMSKRAELLGGSNRE